MTHGNDKPEALARIFETINSTGLTLSVFDLLVARLGTWNHEGKPINLRKLVVTAVDKRLLRRFDDERSLGGTASQQVPRLLALRAGVELKKGDILKTEKQKFLQVAGDAGDALRTSLSTLVARMGVIDDSYLPVKDLIALVGAAYSTLDWATIERRIAN